ncbi:MAG: hypothetical protein R3F17_12410 [Planctomycetota bacterium]
MKLQSFLLAGLVAGLLSACSNCSSCKDDSHTAVAEQHKAITTEVLEPYSCGSIQRMHTLGGVFLASQPAEADLAQARDGGVKTVINMRKPAELKFDEAALVQNLGLNYMNPAWNGVDELTDEVFTEYREMLKTAQRPILLHCGSANRVGAVWITYRVLDEGLSLEAALAEAKVVGLKTAEYEAKAIDYVQRHQK